VIRPIPGPFAAPEFAESRLSGREIRQDGAVPATEPTIIASSIGFRFRGRGPLDWGTGPIYRHAAELANASDGAKLCFVPTAVGDQPEVLSAVYSAFAGSGFQVSHLALFPMPNLADIRAHLLAQDVIWVLGGSVVNLLAVWRAHRLETILHECWQAGVVLGGVSAGSLCWHIGGTTDSFGPNLRPVTNGLAWLPYSNGVHYDAEEQRRPLMHALVADGTIPDGYATDDGTALIYRGTKLAEAVSERPAARAWSVCRKADGTVLETEVPTRLLAS
jgi:peptidase E